LVIGGTRQIGALWRAKRRGARIVQRLDGMNWLHRQQRTGVRHYLRAEYGNRLLAFIRSRLADGVVYQSQFARDWWERVHGRAGGSAVVHNGVDLETYRPGEIDSRPGDRTRLLLVEGSLMGGYELGLGNALALALGMAQQIGNSHSQECRIELLVVGRVPKNVRAAWSGWLAERDRNRQVMLNWAGLLPAEQIPAVDRSAHLLFSADLNPACPNAVIEALACGTPVVAFATGALPELVAEGSGRVVPYGGDPWRLEQPDLPALVEAAAQVLADQERLRAGARARAEAAFGLDRMVDGYVQMLLGEG
jgi:glycosyltransferase involved in cell wall biosynthesis